MSKEFDAYYYIVKHPNCACLKEFEIIGNALKALEIIKEKRVDCLVLFLSQTHIEYNDMCETEKDKLLKEEYVFLKKVLSWKNTLKI